MSDLTRKGLTAFLWDFSGKFSTQLVSFLVTVWLARLLSPSDFGLIAMIMVVVGVAQVFADVGLGASLIQRRHLHPIHFYSVFYVNLVIALALASLVYFNANLIAGFYGNAALKPLTEVISALFLLSALSNVQGVLLRKQLRHKTLAKANVVASIVSGCLGITCAVGGAGVWSLVVQILSQALIVNVFLWSVTGWRPKLAFSFKAVKQLWAFGFKMFISSSLLEAIFVRIDYLIIGKLFSEATLGYFQRAKQFNLLLVQFASGSLMSVLFPLLSQMQRDLPRLRSITLKSLDILCFTLFLLLGGLYLVADELVVFLFSDKWLASAAYLKILLLSSFGYPISALLVNILASRGNANAFLKLELIKKALMIVNFGNAIWNGLEMYLYGLIVVVSLSLAINIYFVNKEIGLSVKSVLAPIVTQLGLSIISTVAAIQACSYLGASVGLVFAAKIVMFTLVFFGLNYLLKTPSIKHLYGLVVLLVYGRRYGN